jgi:hypothetical protein
MEIQPRLPKIYWDVAAWENGQIALYLSLKSAPEPGKVSNAEHLPGKLSNLSPSRSRSGGRWFKPLHTLGFLNITCAPPAGY